MQEGLFSVGGNQFDRQGLICFFCCFFVVIVGSVKLTLQYIESALFKSIKIGTFSPKINDRSCMLLYLGRLLSLQGKWLENRDW